jgi:hypothetical protein
MQQLILAAAVAASMTHPMPGRPGPDDPLAIAPAYEIPKAPESFVWKIVPRAKGTARARIVVLGQERSAIPVGTIPADTEITLDEAALVGRVTHYAVRAELVALESTTQFPAGTRYWVSGLDVKAIAKKPAAK